MRRFTVSLMIIIWVMLLMAGCGSQNGLSGPECLQPNELPAQVDLPDGGALLLWQLATSQLSGSETDSFSLSLDCRPRGGFNVTVELIGASQADLKLTYHIGGQELIVDIFGSGIGEGSIMHPGSVALPADFIIDVSSKNQEPGDFQISVVPEAPPDD